LAGSVSNELHRPLNPDAHLLIVIDVFRLDQHPAFHRPARDVELLDVRFPSAPRLPLPDRAARRRVLPDAHEQVAVEQKANAPEHLLLFHILAAGQPLPDALGEGFIEGHRRLLS
jgi:hypothetical protein